MRLGPEQCRARFVAADHAVLAVNDPDGGPLAVPVSFAVLTTDGTDAVVSAVDFKPKSSMQLRRLRLLAADPRCSLLVQHYATDWERLWWVRVDGLAQLLQPADETVSARAEPLAALAAKYPQYAERPPAGAVIRVTVTRWTGWSGGGAGPTSPHSCSIGRHLVQEPLSCLDHREGDRGGFRHIIRLSHEVLGRRMLGVIP